MKKFVPLDVDSIEEGVFAADANHALQEMVKELVEFVDRYGDKAAGSKADLIVKVTVRADNPDQGYYSLKSQIRTVLPDRPAMVTKAFSEFTDDIPPRHTLFVPSSGSTKDDPRQTRLATQDGREIIEGKPIGNPDQDE